MARRTAKHDRQDSVAAIPLCSSCSTMHLSATARPDGLCFTRTHLHAANSRAVERRTDHRRRHKCKHITCDAAERSTAVGSGTPAAAAVPPTAAAPFSSLPFFPDRRCVEEVDVPPLATCHHYINMTNGIEVIPRLQALSLPYRCVAMRGCQRFVC